MTSEDIKNSTIHHDIRGFPSYSGFKVAAHWLKEIAYQLAVYNEQEAAKSKTTEWIVLDGDRRR